MPRIGITGHIDLRARTLDLVRRAIAARVTCLVGADLVGVSCIAGGADSVFAEVVLDVGGALEVVLPARRYRELAVGDERRAQFDELLRQARGVCVMDFEAPGPEAYRAANLAVISSCDALFAVWDGKEGGRGSTASAVADARAAGLAVDVIWPDGSERRCPAEFGNVSAPT